MRRDRTYETRIRLTFEQQQAAKEVGEIVRERYRTEVTSRFGAKGTKVPNLSSFVNAYCAEQAVARLLALPWYRGDDMKNVRSRHADVGETHEVRWTGAKEPELRVYDPGERTSQDRGHLDRNFWLVTGFPPIMVIEGWLPGHDVMAIGQRRVSPEGRASWFVAPELLYEPPPMQLPPRLCIGCKQEHPPLYTCATGWRPWPGPGPVVGP